MADVLHVPNREQVVTSNAWAFLHWLRTTRGIDLADWAALQRWSATDAAAFGAAIAAFARLPDQPLRLVRRGSGQEALVLRRGGGRIALTADDMWDPHPDPPARSGAGLGWAQLPAEITAPLTRLWPPAALIRPLAELLLHADLRPDDRLLVAASPAWPWLAALLEGTTVILAVATAATLLATAAEEQATVLVAPAQLLAEAAFQRARSRPNLATLRTIVATGGPLSPEGRARIYTWIKSDLMLLARTGDTAWGNPLEPVLARPPATAALLTPPPSVPATR
ncbi:MAG TPA: hypothetical protein VHT74_15195 [Acetobacteraceae bacterium]|jgi:hypothetical protein|nr:hypothetical protein [Acetobacteraceae bacterium]